MLDERLIAPALLHKLVAPAWFGALRKVEICLTPRLLSKQYQ
jgi:hypothetical protein